MINSCTCLSIAVVSEALFDWVVGFTQKCSNPLLAQCCDTFASSSSTASLSTASLFALTLTIASVLKLCPFDVSDFSNSGYNNVHIPQCNYNVEANHSVMTQCMLIQLCRCTVQRKPLLHCSGTHEQHTPSLLPMMPSISIEHRCTWHPGLHLATCSSPVHRWNTNRPWATWKIWCSCDWIPCPCFRLDTCRHP